MTRLHKRSHLNSRQWHKQETTATQPHYPFARPQVVRLRIPERSQPNEPYQPRPKAGGWMPELYARLLRMYTEATSMTQLSDIVRTDPDILGGTPVFVGTRVPIQSLFDYLEGGETLDEFLRQFPSVRRDQAIAALDLARATLLASARSS